MWQLPAGHSEMFYFLIFLAGSILFYFSYTVFATPWVALGYELTPDYHERTRLMATMNFMGQFAWISLPWFYAIMENDRLFANSVQGARVLAIAIGIFVALVGIIQSEGDLPLDTTHDCRKEREAVISCLELFGC